MSRILVTGGVRSGKSRHAEGLLAGEPDTTYLAAGPSYDDADWAARIAKHRNRRPDSWVTVETSDLAPAVVAADRAGRAILIDCLGTWLTGLLDRADLWDAPTEEVEQHVGSHAGDLIAALLTTTRPVVLVTNEVGLGVVPAHRSGRLFRDLLGTINQEVGAACDEVHLVVAGKVLRLGATDRS